MSPTRSLPECGIRPPELLVFACGGGNLREAELMMNSNFPLVRPWRVWLLSTANILSCRLLFFLFSFFFASLGKVFDDKKSKFQHMWLSKANFSVERVLVQVFFYLDFHSQFEANGPNRCYFPFQVPLQSKFVAQRISWSLKRPQHLWIGNWGLQPWSSKLTNIYF